MSEQQTWYWDGSQLCPLSPDGRWHWDGGRWLPTPTGFQVFRSPEIADPKPRFTDRVRALPRWLVWRWIVWSVLLVVWIPVIFAAGDHHASDSTLIILASTLGGLALVATLVLGVSLGRRRAWGYLGWSLLVAAFWLGLFLFFAFASSEPNNGHDDPGMGIGAMFALVVCLIPVSWMLWAGGGLGAIVSRVTPGQGTQIAGHVDPKEL